MKKLFALLLALCLLCGVTVVQAETTMPVSTVIADATFEIPGEWYLDVSQDESWAYIAYAYSPENLEMYITITDADGYSDYTSQSECFEEIYTENHGGTIDFAVTEDYADMMPDLEPLAIGDCGYGRSYSFSHRYSDIMVYLLITDCAYDDELKPFSEFLDIALPIFTSMSTAAIEADRTTNADAIQSRISEFQLANATFQLPEGYTVETSGNFAMGEGAGSSLLMVCCNWEDEGMDITVTGDLQVDNAFWCAYLLAQDQDFAATLASTSLVVDANMPDGKPVLMATTDSVIYLAHYYNGTGFLLAVLNEGDTDLEAMTLIAFEMAQSFRLDGVSEEQMAADAAANAASVQQYVIITNTSVNLRSGPDASYTKIGVAYEGDSFPLLGESGNWYMIDVNGQTGYVSKNLSTVK